MKRLAYSLKTKKLLQFAAAITLLLTLTACPSDPIDTTGNLVGVVTDARTGALLKGVSVSLSPTGKTYTTGEDGKFEFRYVETQQYTVTASKTDYRSDKKTAFVKAGEDTNLDFQLVPATGDLSLSHTSLDFGPVNTKLTLKISNKGIAAMKWSVAEDIAWLSCNPTSGTTQAGETSSIEMTVDRSGMSRGSYTNTIAILTDTGGSGEVSVTMTVPGISVDISPEQLDFGSTNTTLNLSLTNTGSGSISFSASASNEWIHLSDKTGNFNSSKDIAVSVDRNGLAEGDHSGKVTLTLNGEEREIPVKMNIPSKALPIVSTGAASNISYSSADISGALVSIGSSKVTKYGFCWTTAHEPTVDDNKCNLGDTDKAKDYSYRIEDLAPGTTYYVRAYAENAVGVSYGEEVKFETKAKPTLAGVSTGNVTDITYSSANVAGSITSLGNNESVQKYGHVWSKNSKPTTDDQKTEFGPTSKTGSFNSAMTDLMPGTTYHVRAYATNSLGTQYGDDVTFTTHSANDINITDYEEDNKWKP